MSEARVIRAGMLLGLLALGGLILLAVTGSEGAIGILLVAGLLLVLFAFGAATRS